MAAEPSGRAADAGVAAGSYLPELESLRGIAILLVFWFHVEGILFLPYRRPQVVDLPWQALIRAGHTGVSLFFVLSAFLLSLPFWREPSGGPYLSIARYGRRRALRILPLYWFAVAVGAVLSAGAFADLGRAIPHALFLSSVAGWWTPLYPYSGVWWSLATEVQFYLLLPLLLLCRRWRHGGALGLALLAAVVVVHGLFLAGVIGARSQAGQVQLADSIIGRAPQFLIGGAAAWLYLRTRGALPAAPTWWRNGGADLALFGALTALALELEWVMAGGLEHFVTVPFQAWHILEALLWATVLLLVLVAPLRTKRVWANPVLEWLGLLSYSIYMWHLPIAWHVVIGLRHSGVPVPAGWSALGLVAALLIASLCLGLSMLTYRFIERPFLVRKASLR